MTNEDMKKERKTTIYEHPLINGYKENIPDLDKIRNPVGSFIVL